MKDNGLAWNVEQFAIELLSANKQLKGTSIVHFDEDKGTKPERMVVEATVGERQLDAIPGFMVALKVTHYSSTGTAERRNKVRNAILEAMHEGSGTRPAVPSLGNFSDLRLWDDVSSSTTANGNSRESSITFSIRAVPRITAMYQTANA